MRISAKGRYALAATIHLAQNYYAGEYVTVLLSKTTCFAEEAMPIVANDQRDTLYRVTLKTLCLQAFRHIIRTLMLTLIVSILAFLFGKEIIY